jgi:transposase
MGMKAIPIAMRERILKLYEQGKSSVEIAEFAGFCVAAVCRVRQQFKERGTVKPRTHLCGRKTLLTAERKARLQKLVEAKPDATLAEFGAQMDRPFGTSTMDLWLRRLGLSYKKNAARRRAAPARRGRTKGALARTTGGGTRRPARVRG